MNPYIEGDDHQLAAAWERGYIDALEAVLGATEAAARAWCADNPLDRQAPMVRDRNLSLAGRSLQAAIAQAAREADGRPA